MANHSIREAVVAYRRAPGLGLLSATSIGLSLFVLGTFGIVTYNVDVTLQAIERRVEVVAYLRDDITAAKLEVLQSDVISYPEVEEVVHVSKFEAMRNAPEGTPERQAAMCNMAKILYEDAPVLFGMYMPDIWGVAPGVDLIVDGAGNPPFELTTIES